MWLCGGRSPERVGTLKGLVRVLKRAPDAEKGLPCDLAQLLTPASYTARRARTDTL